MMGLGVWMWVRSSGHHHDHVHVDGTTEGKTTMREALILGLASGIVPCPAGVSLLLGAAGMGSPARSVGLVLWFSAGIGVVVTGVALALATLQRQFAPFWDRFERGARMVPRFSAAVVMGWGAWLAVEAVRAWPTA